MGEEWLHLEVPAHGCVLPGLAGTLTSGADACSPPQGGRDPHCPLEETAAWGAEGGAQCHLTPDPVLSPWEAPLAQSGALHGTITCPGAPGGLISHCLQAPEGKLDQRGLEVAGGQRAAGGRAPVCPALLAGL